MLMSLNLIVPPAPPLSQRKSPQVETGTPHHTASRLAQPSSVSITPHICQPPRVFNMSFITTISLRLTLYVSVCLCGCVCACCTCMHVCVCMLREGGVQNKYVTSTCVSQTLRGEQIQSFPREGYASYCQFGRALHTQTHKLWARQNTAWQPGNASHCGKTPGELHIAVICNMRLQLLSVYVCGSVL